MGIMGLLLADLLGLPPAVLNSVHMGVGYGEAHALAVKVSRASGVRLDRYQDGPT